MHESSELGLTRVGLALLRELLTERTGLYYPEEREDLLAERLAAIVIDRGFHSYLDLFYLLKYEDNPLDWARVIDELSVPETYFWREVDQIRAVVDRLVPKIAARWTGGPLRIWSIPCASGEEPLTIALLLEEGGWFDRVPIEVHASDASPAAIARAVQGFYRGRSFRTLPPAMKEKYFVALDGGWTPVSALRSRISSWSVVNLLEADRFGPLRTCPVVFCRNAFIYFSPDAIRRTVGIFATAMPTPGYLCVGASESLLNVTSAFTLQEVDGAFVYAKQGKGAD
jgi:chemotaxis protein methyltransferase CheR